MRNPNSSDYHQNPDLTFSPNIFPNSSPPSKSSPSFSFENPGILSSGVIVFATVDLNASLSPFLDSAEPFTQFEPV